MNSSIFVGKVMVSIFEVQNWLQCVIHGYNGHFRPVIASLIEKLAIKIRVSKTTKWPSIDGAWISTARLANFVIDSLSEKTHTIWLLIG